MLAFYTNSVYNYAHPNENFYFTSNREVIKMKKLLAVLMALTLVFAFAACAKQPADNGDAEKTLIMGTNAAFPPYEFVADDGSFAGIDVEIAQAVAEKLGIGEKAVDNAMQRARRKLRHLYCNRI